jgi:hypothetical protein
MNKRASSSGVWSRPDGASRRTGPKRGFGGYYRSADREVDGKLLRGVPLNTAEDAALAAVRMAYRIADSQIDRGLRIARDLRGAARKEGIEPRDAVDASERLLSKALLAGLQWFESASGEERHPLRRLAAAEYRMLGSLFGIAPDKTKAAPADEAQAGAGARESAAAGPRGSAPSEARVQVINKADKTKRRPVLSARLTLAQPLPRGSDDGLSFHHVDAEDADKALSAKIHWDEKTAPQLSIEACMTHRRGCWFAGIYDRDGLQIGVITIEL